MLPWIFVGAYEWCRIKKCRKRPPEAAVLEGDAFCCESTHGPRMPPDGEGHFSQGGEGVEIELFACRQPKHIIIRFLDDKSHGHFMSQVKDGNVRIVDHRAALREVHLSFDDAEDLHRLLSRSNVTRYSFAPGHFGSSLAKTAKSRPG